MAGDELGARGEADATVEVVVTATPGVPAARSRAELPSQDQLGANFLEPSGEQRPRAEHDLVDNVELLAGALHEAGVGQGIHRRGEPVGDVGRR